MFYHRIFNNPHIIRWKSI